MRLVLKFLHVLGAMLFIGANASFIALASFGDGLLPGQVGEHARPGGHGDLGGAGTRGPRRCPRDVAAAPGQALRSSRVGEILAGR